MKKMHEDALKILFTKHNASDEFCRITLLIFLDLKRFSMNSLSLITDLNNEENVCIILK